MKTALLIDDEVLRRLRDEAERRGSTPEELLSEALRMLEPGRREGKRVALPSFHGGLPLVDLADRDALFRAMEEV
jgi:hypothetical protein